MNEEEKIEKIRKILQNSPPTKHEVKKISKMVLRLSKDHSSSKSSVNIVLQVLKLFPKEKKIHDSLKELEHPKRLRGIHYLVCKGHTSLEKWINTIAEEWDYLKENKDLLYEFMEMAESGECKEGLKRKIQKNEEREKYSKIEVEWKNVSRQDKRERNDDENIDFKVKI